MTVQKSLTRKQTINSGNLGVIQRSIGYLQGGYKDTTIHSKIQLFNTVTQVGLIVFDTGYQRYYRPGVSGNFAGYFNISDTAAYNKFNYITVSASVSFNTAKNPGVTASDLNIYSQAWILCSTATSYTTGVEEWMQLNLSTDTIISNGNLSAGPNGTTRQAMSTGIAGFFLNYNTPAIYTLNFTTKAITYTGAPATLNTTIQYACGMSVNNTYGYFVGMNQRNIKLNIATDAILSFVTSTAYTYHFGESHSIASNTDGYMMAGYNDTTGRYGSTQHGLCQKITFANESITTLPDLVLAQSSGQMMNGF